MPEEYPSQAATPPVVLTIAGSDSGGGAGIQADLLTFEAHAVFGTTAVTAVTAQNSLGVTGMMMVSREILQRQILCITEDFNVRATKTGMLGSIDNIELITADAKNGTFESLVVDPVMVATSGARLVEDDARDAYLELLAYVDVVTPNLFEAEYLTGLVVRDRGGMELAARRLSETGVKLVVIKGGHLADGTASDLLYDGHRVELLERPRIATQNVHGTGCTLSAAITANIALGSDPHDAIALAKDYVTRGLQASRQWCLGKGPGPLNHHVATRD